MPRDAAGHLELKEGTGGIIAMCSCEGFLEVYKQDVTYRIQTPETIDPDRTNPRAAFVAAVVDNVGSSNPVVARMLLQGLEILNGAVFDRRINKEAVAGSRRSDELWHECARDVPSRRDLCRSHPQGRDAR